MVTPLASFNLNDYGKPVIADILLKDGSDDDLSTATTTNFKVLKPDDTFVTWPATVVGLNTMQYVLQPGDLDIVGCYKLDAEIVKPAEGYSTNAIVFEVKDPHA